MKGRPYDLLKAVPLIPKGFISEEGKEENRNWLTQVHLKMAIKTEEEDEWVVH